MKNKRSWITWGIIFLILVGSGILTVALPSLLGGGQSLTPLPSETTMTTVPLPVPIGGRSEITLASWQWMLGLAILIPGLVIGAGLTLAIVYVIISRLVARTEESRDFKESSAALEKRYNDQVAALRQTRPTSRAPESTWRRWSVITTALIGVMFIAFATLLLASMIFPTGQIIRGPAIVNITSGLVLVAVILGLTAMALWLRSDKIAAVDQTDALAIPWDFIAVLITGLIVVGFGLGVLAILNLPQ